VQLDSYSDVEAEARKPRAQAWIASEDDPVIVGRLVAIEPGETEYGPAQVAVVEQRDGERRSVWVLQQLLREEFARLSPQVGEVIAIGYHGRKISQTTGNPYDVFRVAVDRSSEPFDWAVVLENDEPGGETFEQPSAQTDEIPF
jgi:hypothetical protein